MNQATRRTIYAILVSALLIPASLACTVCGPMVNLPPKAATEVRTETSAEGVTETGTIAPEVFVSDLGNVYGIAFDEEGYLFATGTEGDRYVVWRIDQNGEKEMFVELLDRGDALSDAGLAAHAPYLANLAIDGGHNIWITSRRQGACFVVTPERDAFKAYLNGYMSVTLQDALAYSQGVAWDGDADHLYIITSGPESEYGTILREHIRTLTLDEINDIVLNKRKTVNNTGLEIQEKGNGLVQGQGTLYLLGQQALYEVKPDGQLEKAGAATKGMTLWGGAADGAGAIYLGANDADYTPEEAQGENGLVLKVDSEGKQNVLLEDVGQPLGMAYQGGYLYIADRATGSILRVEIR
jgi:sugar lactone lactonase YvrE